MTGSALPDGVEEMNAVQPGFSHRLALLVVAAVFFGRKIEGEPMEAWSEEPRSAVEGAGGGEDFDEHRTPGTLVLVAVFLSAFAVYYFANWMWLADVWEVR